MKQLILIVVIVGLTFRLSAQESAEKVMEKRAREMHRVIGLDDQEQWKKFIKENYSQALIDKPMRAVTSTSDNGSTTSTTNQPKTTDNLEAKVAMFQRLHEDFGKSKILSVKQPGEGKLEMVVKSDDGLSATFNFKFDKSNLIDGLGIEVQDIER